MRPWKVPAFVLLAWCSASSAPAATLVQDGKAKSVIILPSEAQEPEKLAARELADHIEKITGVRLEPIAADASALAGLIRDARVQGKATVVLGKLALPLVRRVLQVQGQM